ncbi:F-box protein, partial [Tanacetum coccineum]
MVTQHPLPSVRGPIIPNPPIMRNASIVNDTHTFKALDSFLKGAACGSTLAMVDTGLVYWEIGKKDEGVRMYKRVVELGDPAGQCNLGISYLQ